MTPCLAPSCRCITPCRAWCGEEEDVDHEEHDEAEQAEEEA